MKNALYIAACIADEKYNYELVRQFGAKAGDMRYLLAHHDDNTRSARVAKYAADDACRACGRKAVAR